MSWNYIPELISAGVLLIILIFYQRSNYVRSESAHMFTLALVIAIFSCFINTASVICIVHAAEIPLWVNYVVNDAFFLVSPLQVVLFCNYFQFLLHEEAHSTALYKAGKIVSYFFYVLIVAGVAVNHFVPILFYFDEAKTYTRGALNSSVIWVCMIYILFTAVALLSQWKKITPSIRRMLAILPCIAIPLVIVQALLQNLQLQGTIFMLCMFTLFLSFYNRTASSDQLANCYNREAFNVTMKRVYSSKMPDAFIMVGLRNFYSINTEYGWEVGNDLLREVVKEMMETFGHDNVFRIASTQFVCAIHKGRAEDYVKIGVERFRKDWRVGEFYCVIECDFSYANCSDVPEAKDRMLDLLSYGMAQAAHAQKGHSVRCDKRLLGEMEHETVMIQAVRAAIAEQRIERYYYPICRIQGEIASIIAAECVVKIRDEEMGLIDPSDYIDVDASNALTDTMNFAVLKSVCDFQERLNDMGLEYLWLSCNLTRNQISSPTMVQRILSMIGASNASILRIYMQVSYGDSETDPSAIENAIARLKNRGITIVVSEGGFGHITDMLYTPASYVKFGEHFLETLERYGRERRFFKEVVRQFHENRITVIASNVDSRDRFELVKEMGIKVMQGSYLFPAMEEEAFVRLVAENRSYVCAESWEQNDTF